MEYECNAGGRSRELCDECRREANRISARASAARRTPEEQRKTNADWTARNLELRRRIAREWAKRNRDSVTANTQAYRARKAGLFRHHVDRGVLYEIDRGLCGICGEPVERDSSWHVDHIVPLSKGGEHSYLNCQVSHGPCNQRKNAKLP
jgi:5-methylcytosine-specific restriction endonuclease McrA